MKLVEKLKLLRELFVIEENIIKSMMTFLLRISELKKSEDHYKSGFIVLRNRKI